MNLQKPETLLRHDLILPCACAAVLVVVNLLVGNGYGFHRDEFQFLDNALHLDWGFVAYPPLTAFCGRIAIALFGISPQVFRLPAAFVNAASLVLVSLIARELGGRRWAQIIALFAAFPLALAFSSVLQYNTFDLFSWLLLIFCTARVLGTGDQRNWLGAGLAIGLGVQSKYSIAFPVASLLGALIVLPSQRHHLRSRWFWYGALVAAIVAAPNLVWLARHDFITLHMEHFIHARDVRQGRADGFYTDQIKFTMLALPLALFGLIRLVRSARFRLLSAFYIGPFLLFALARGRGYYLMPAYPILFAAGAVGLEEFLSRRSTALRAGVRGVVVAAMLLDTAAVGWAYLPIWHPGSAGWNWQMKNNGDMADEVGWPEFVAQVAAVRDTIPTAERGRLAIITHNYGEAGALELYGPKYGLPTAISNTNSFHARGFGAFEPETVIVVGTNLDDQLQSFETCSVASTVTMPMDVRNEESRDHPQILICRHLLTPWKATWDRSQEFG